MKLALTSLVLSLVICLFLLDALSSATAAERVALVIGNSAYQHTAALPNPRNDAKAIGATLAQLGFDVDTKLDLSRTDFDRSLRRFGDRLERADVALFYYAGHGIQVNGENYLVPIDARLRKKRDLNYEVVKLTHVLGEMETRRRVNLVFLDACRDNPLGRSLATDQSMTRSIVGRGLARVDAATGTLISYATKDGAVASDGPDKHSPYTQALLKHMKEPNLEIGIMLRRVRRTVMQATSEQQVPWEYGSLLGEFFFMAGGIVVEETPTPIPAKKTGTLNIKTKPPGATVWIDGKRRGTAPISLAQLKPGRISVKASKQGYATVAEQVWVRAGKVSEVTLILEKMVATGDIEIKSTPAGAKWYVDGAYAGTTPDRMADVGKGAHQIEVIKPGYQPWTRSIEITASRTARLHARLQAEKVEYALTVDTEPRDARVRILNIAPKYYSGIRLKPGRYHVEVSKEGYETHKEWVELTKYGSCGRGNCTASPGVRCFSN